MHIVEATKFPTHLYFKILCNPDAPDGSMEGQEDERIFRDFRWGFDTANSPGPDKCANIKREMQLIVEHEMACLCGTPLTTESIIPSHSRPSLVPAKVAALTTPWSVPSLWTRIKQFFARMWAWFIHLLKGVS